MSKQRYWKITPDEVEKFTYDEKKLLNWEPKLSLDKGMDEYFEWLNDNEHLVPKWL